MRRFDKFSRSLPGPISYNSLVVEGQLVDLAEQELCINCTPVPITKLMSRKALSKAKRILELRYVDFKSSKPSHIGGSYMLAVQAVENFKLMTGIAVNLGVVLRIINKALR
jgi:shikimate 5-dehydrogenase